MSHKDWELPNSRIWLVEIANDCCLDFSIYRIHFDMKKLETEIQKCWCGVKERKGKGTSKRWQIWPQLIVVHNQNVSFYNPVTLNESFFFPCLPYNEHLKSVSLKISRIGRQKRNSGFFLIWPKEPFWWTIFGNDIKRFDFLFLSSKFTKLENWASGPSVAAMRLGIWHMFNMLVRTYQTLS